MSKNLEQGTKNRSRSKKVSTLLFFPNRGRDWRWFDMVFLYLFSFISAVSSVLVLILTDIELSEKIVTALIFFLVSIVLWVLARRCSRIVAKMGQDDRQDHPYSN